MLVVWKRGELHVLVMPAVVVAEDHMLGRIHCKWRIVHNNSPPAEGRSREVSYSYVLIDQDGIPIRVHGNEARRPRRALVRLQLQRDPSGA